MNNAAIAIRVRHTRAPLEEIPLDEFDRMLAVNLKGVFLCSRAVLPHMKEQGYGKIINMSSGTFFNGRENLVHYVASKGGVIAFTRVLAREAGPSGIRVNSHSPRADGERDRGALPGGVRGAHPQPGHQTHRGARGPRRRGDLLPCPRRATSSLARPSPSTAASWCTRRSMSFRAECSGVEESLGWRLQSQGLPAGTLLPDR